MTAPVNLTELQRVILLLYSMQEADIKALEGELLDALKRDWITALEEKARSYGCRKVANAPSGGYLADLKDRAKQDAASIANTWNRELENEIRRIFDSNPRANRYFYMDTLEAWASRRNQWKGRQISVQTAQYARVTAQNAFRLENGLRGKMYRYTGPPPVSDICQERTAWGLVPQSVADKNPTPAHPGPCVHEWQEVIDERLDCAEMWVG